jgi:hypothetical protein
MATAPQLTYRERITAWLREAGPLTVAQLAETMAYDVSERTLNRILTDYPEFAHAGATDEGWPLWGLAFDPDPPPPLELLPSIPHTPYTVCNVCVEPVLTDEYGRCPKCETPLLVWPKQREYNGRIKGPKSNLGMPVGMLDEVVDEAYRLYCEKGWGLVRVSEALVDRTRYVSARAMSRSLHVQFQHRGWPVRTRLCGMVTFNYRHGKLRREWALRDHAFALAEKHRRGEMRMVKCKALKTQAPGKGKPCGHYALADSEYCQSHDPRRLAAVADHLARMRARRPPRTDLLTDEERRAIHELHGQGLTRNAIARQIGRPWTTVNRILRETPD